MFGLFGSKRDAQKAYEELLAYLTDDWEMKGRYAGAFLEAYRRSISKIYGEVMKRYDAIAPKEEGCVVPDTRRGEGPKAR